jgi:FkbM family methyltransferase
MIATLVRGWNYLNPTTYGHMRLSLLPRLLGADPAAGVFRTRNGMVLELDPRDELERCICYHGFEVLGTRVLLGRLRPGAVFVDVGANIGYYAIQAYRRVGPAGRVLAFEPHPVTMAKLRRNVALSGAGGIELFEVALSDRAGDATLFCPRAGHHGLSSLRPQGRSGHDAYTVRAARLDDLLPPDLTRLDLIKADAEGAEGLVFRGAEATVRRFRPAVILELNGPAARAFGRDRLDAVRLLLSWHPDYRLRLLGQHSRRRVTLDDLEREDVTSINVMLY